MEISMTKIYRVTFECFDKENPAEIISKSTVLEGQIERLVNCLTFSIGLEKQVQLIKNVQNSVFLRKLV